MSHKYQIANARAKSDFPSAVSAEPHVQDVLAKSILAGGWTQDNCLTVLANVRQLLTSAGRKGRPSKGAHLAIRPGDEKRKAKIVIRDDGKEIGTGLDAEKGKLPEENPLAVAKLISHIDAQLRGLKARIDTERVRINDILFQYIEATEPKQKSAMTEQMDYWKATANSARQLMEFFGTRMSTVKDFEPDAGNAYWGWRSHQELKRKIKDSQGKQKTAADRSVATHLIVLRAALRWYVRKHRATVRIEFDWPRFPLFETEWWTWDEIVRLLYAAMGLQWDKTQQDWKRKTAIIDGKERQVFDLLPREERRRLKPLVRFILIYCLTGTRFKALMKLLWKAHKEFGSIDVIKGLIWRNGRGARRNKIKRKPQSQLLESFLRKLRIWQERDQRDGFALVIHTATGNPVSNIRTLFNGVAESVGLDTKPHRLKHSGVTLAALAGFTVGQIAQLFGTREQTLRDHYLHIDWDGGVGPLQQEKELGLKSISDIGRHSPKSAGDHVVPSAARRTHTRAA